MGNTPTEPFFEPLPEPPSGDEAPPGYFQNPAAPPENVVPVPVPHSVVLARTEDTVLVLGGLEVYPQGLAYRVDMFLRPGTEPREGDALGHGAFGEVPRVGWLLGSGVKVGASADFMGFMAMPEEVIPEEDVPPQEPRPDRPSLADAGFSWGGLRGHLGHWLWPLPDGDVWTLVCQWDARDIPETRTMIDGAAVRAAAAQSPGELWEIPPMPEGAEVGWFAYAPMSGSTYQPMRSEPSPPEEEPGD